jgi:hypothetical protein
MQGTVLVDKPFPDEPPLEQIYNDLLIGDVGTVGEKLAAEIRATDPVHMCFVQGWRDSAPGSDALNGAADERGQAAGRAGTRPARSQRGGVIQDSKRPNSCRELSVFSLVG